MISELHLLLSVCLPALVHTFPRAQDFDYDRIIHIFSFSKSFGIPGWRVGYALFPPCLSLSFRKVRALETDVQ